MLNRISLVGRVGRDVELKQTQGGKCVAKFSIATIGATHKDTEWHNVICWDKLAENCAKYLSRGSQCFVEGRLTTRKWEAKDGSQKQTTEVIANQVLFLGSIDRGEDAYKATTASQFPPGTAEPEDDGDIPF